ncbi:hypothetical protein ABB37_09489 [Leptomonas pyrrhocoris]|uniref:Uncharacterized protein n=1 Tax=Leptomonas pyrrhocoris TaxID=157538 RepID=A0A0M9FQ87_LEPPY|nr:hypothetical protein ABB37_09489 [Leptomonas pyrrhocoris]KPA73855.1 hypothetical protein ABB37_09489 [Leptomonas pyrrhocoris]|eukprot:XP_015652294.1 hypothetical protein ABB37_09489 [Leptomonas pyrrhocoris]
MSIPSAVVALLGGSMPATDFASCGPNGVVPTNLRRPPLEFHCRLKISQGMVTRISVSRPVLPCAQLKVQAYFYRS